MSNESNTFASEMYGMESNLQQKDNLAWVEWEAKTGKIWRKELDNAQDWNEAYRNNPVLCYSLKQELKSLL